MELDRIVPGKESVAKSQGQSEQHINKVFQGEEQLPLRWAIKSIYTRQVTVKDRVVKTTIITQKGNRDVIKNVMFVDEINLTYVLRTTNMFK